MNFSLLKPKATIIFAVIVLGILILLDIFSAFGKGIYHKHEDFYATYGYLDIGDCKDALNHLFRDTPLLKHIDFCEEIPSK